LHISNVIFFYGEVKVTQMDFYRFIFIFDSLFFQ